MRRPASDFNEESTGIAAGPRGDSPGALLVVVLGGSLYEFVIPPQGTPLVVGRSPACAIHVDDASVSRQHARIVPVEDGCLIQDLGSKNGTWVNGSLVSGRGTLIRPGDAIRFGNIQAHVSEQRVSRVLLARRLSAVEFDERVAEEGERCVRYDRNLVLVAIELSQSDDQTMTRASLALPEAVRTLDATTVRAPGRLDVLLVECGRDEGREIAQRIHRALEHASVRSRIGVASYPGDVGSIDSLHVAARTAMLAVEEHGVETSGHSVRCLQLGEREVLIAEPAMVRLYALVERLASAPTPILIHGETGSGKELIAEALHELGSRKSGHLVKINCAAVPEALLESELFGHERGSFTGAEVSKPGLFETADRGTLFLDEIGELPASVQAKLLRVLEDRKVRRIGAVRERAVDVRFVAATHRDLSEMVANGRFRQDLFFRLGAFVLSVPPLRERRREIPLLAERFAVTAAIELGHEFAGFAPEVVSTLESHEWPGNVRELRNVVASAVLIARSHRVEVQDLPAELRPQEPVPVRAAPSARGSRHPTIPMGVAVPIKQSIEDELRHVERERLIEALEYCAGNQTKAAEYLNMPRRTFVRKIAQYQIPTGRRRAIDDAGG